MSFSQGFRAVNLWGKRFVCKLWSPNCASVSSTSRKARRDANKSVVKSNSLPMMSIRSLCMTDSRHFSSDSRDFSLEDERRKLRNDPEIRAWMSQIAQDFETAPFQALEVQDKPRTQDSLDSVSSSEHVKPRTQDSLDNVSSSEHVASVQDASGTEIEVEEFGYVEDDEDEFADPVPERTLPVSLKRGQHGVFDVEEIVAVLEDENGVDIQVIDIPPEARFVDHMVIVSGKSLRHMRAMAASIKWLYKRKKVKSDRQFKLEGKDCKDWFAMDLGNIAVHIFTPQARQHYDLETLWTLGPEHDDQRHYVHDDSLNLSAADLFWLESGSGEEASSMQATDDLKTLPSEGGESGTVRRADHSSDDVKNHIGNMHSSKLGKKEKL